MRAKLQYKAESFGLETFPRGTAPSRHLHVHSYASVVLCGSFVEAGFGGRVNVQPGDVLLHGKFDCHANRSTCSCAVTLLCLPWRDDWTEGHFHVADPDFLVRLAEKDARESMSALATDIQRPTNSRSLQDGPAFRSAVLYRRCLQTHLHIRSHEQWRRSALNPYQSTITHP